MNSWSGAGERSCEWWEYVTSNTSSLLMSEIYVNCSEERKAKTFFTDHDDPVRNSYLEMMWNPSTSEETKEAALAHYHTLGFLPLAAQKVRKMVDNIRYLVGMEALYAAQAIDLRKQKRPLPLGRVTGRAYEAFREVIPFLGEDRNMHLEIQHAYDFIASRKLMEIIGEDGQNPMGQSTLQT